MCFGSCTQPVTRKLQQICCRMRSHRLLRLDDNKFAASCQQACCKLIIKTFYPVFQDSFSTFLVSFVMKDVSSFMLDN